LTTEYDALGFSHFTLYDGLGRATQRGDAKNQLTNYSYDNAGRILSMVTTGTSGNSNISTSFVYNDGGSP